MILASLKSPVAGSPVRLNVTQYFPKTLRTLYRGWRAWTFNGFANNDAAVSNIEWQRNEISNSGHDFAPTQSYQS
jgi:hypothetical protein